MNQCYGMNMSHRNHEDNDVGGEVSATLLQYWLLLCLCGVIVQLYLIPILPGKDLQLLRL